MNLCVDKVGFLIDNIYIRLYKGKVFLLRVIAGELRGRRLVAPEGLETRPTSDKVKEALFSIIQFELEGAEFLDLYAGSGQMGIEAISRGAEKSVFVDFGKKPCECIKQNVVSLGISDKAEIYQKGVEDFLSTHNKKYDFIFLDPPYKKDMINPLLERAAELCKDSGAIICEISRGEDVFEEVGGFYLKKRYRYSKTELAVFRKRDGETEIY